MSCVLLVDDEKNVLKALSMGLRRLSYDVEEAQAGPDALKLLEKRAVDVVVSDIKMSPMDGYTLASEIHKRHPQIPVILMSAYGFENQQVEEKNGIIYPKLTKPFSVHQLVEKLKEVESSWSLRTGSNPIRVLVFGDNNAIAEIRNALEPSGFRVTGFDSREALLRMLGQSAYDYLIIDEDKLKDTGWKILNDLEVRQPKIPVFILVEGSETSSRRTGDMGVTLISRRKFLKDRNWMESCFNEQSAS